MTRAAGRPDLSDPAAGTLEMDFGRLHMTPGKAAESRGFGRLEIHSRSTQRLQPTRPGSLSFRGPSTVRPGVARGPRFSDTGRRSALLGLVVD